MNRNEFLKKLGIGLGVAVVAPTLLKAEEISPNEKVRFCVDVSSISNFQVNGHIASPADVLNLYQETGILIYDSREGNPPQLIKGEVEVVDVAKYAR